MNSSDLLTGPCSVGRAAELLGDRWTLLIVRSAMLGKTRFDQFKATLGIADNILSNRLGRMVDAGILGRVPYQDGARTRQHYPLTEAGAALRPVLEAMAVWGHEFANPEVPTTAVGVMHVACGNLTDNGAWCANCEIPLSNSDVAWVMPWLSDAPLPLASAAA